MYKRITVDVPNTFSLIDNPKESIEALSKFAYNISTFETKNLFFDHGEMIEFNLGAESVLDYLAEEYDKQTNRKKKRVNFSGAILDNNRILRFMKGIGILASLEIQGQNLDKREEEQVEIFKQGNLKYVEETQTHNPSYVSRISNDFVCHIDGCLGRVGRELTMDAKAALAEYVSEIIDNIEEHSGRDDWRITGYLDTLEEKGLCEISIFNFGKPICETFFSVPDNSKVGLKLNQYLRSHSDNGLSTDRHKRCLATIFALQEANSSKNLTATDRRGSGTVSLIDLFERMSNECRGSRAERFGCAKMAILSGDVHILFDGTYKMCREVGQMGTIAFNKTNDLSKPYDTNYISTIEPHCFPGTVVCIQFPLSLTWTTEAL